jgi:hypothetical protein
MTEHGFGYWSKMLHVACGRGTCDGDLLPERNAEETLKTAKYNPAMGSMLLDVCVNVRKA